MEGAEEPPSLDRVSDEARSHQQTDPHHAHRARTTGRHDIANDLRSAWRDELDDVERDVLGLVVSTGVDRVDSLGSLVGRRGIIAELDRLPLVEVDRVRIQVDERWADVVDLGPDHVGDLAADLVRALLEAPCSEADLADAARLALAAFDRDGFRSVIRAALSEYPPKVGIHTLRRWIDADLLPPHDPHVDWLAGIVAALRSSDLHRAAELLASTRAAFAATGDPEAEIDVGLALGIVARRTDDVATLAALVERSHEVEAAGAPRAAYTRLLGEALLHQMSGEPEQALELLDTLPGDAFGGDWAAQVRMMRATNLMLCGRSHEALAQLDAATGVGDAWSHATALSLSATARWASGELDRAIDDLAEAEHLARRAGAVSVAELARATRAAMLATLGDPDAQRVAALAGAGAHLDDEGRRLVEVARAMQAAGDGDIALARSIITAIGAPGRAVLSTFWTVALGTALDPDAAQHWERVVEQHQPLEPARRAGLAAAEHLAGGRAVPAELSPYLPAAWCETVQAPVELRLLGAATVRRDRSPVEHRNWNRSRVRELCLHLAVVDHSSRESTAAHLWPDLAPDAAARNLRVTLSNLLDVIDPSREKGSGSDLVEDDNGVLRFADTDRIRIDLRRAADAAREVLSADAAGDSRMVLAAARRLRREPAGKFLAGSGVGEWIEPHIRRWTDLMTGAAAAAAPTALAAGDPELAEALVNRGLELDPWAERLHQLLVRVRLDQDDLDGARRAWRVAVDHLDELGLRPEAATIGLGRELGVR